MQILVDIDKVLKQWQHDNIKVYCGIATIEELYESFHISPVVKKEGFPPYLQLTDLENCISTIEKYLTKEEAERLQKPGPKFPTFPLHPEGNK